jgi:hypothetical protein
MSWSIWLSGSKEFIRSKLDGAISILQQASDALDNVERPLVSLQASGSAYDTPGGSCSFSGSFTVSGETPSIAIPEPEPTIENS